MRWFRANTRFGSRLALVALAIQLVLSFSHIDLCDLGAGPAKAAVAAADAVLSGPGKNAPADKSDRPASCPICALIQLAATATPSVPPALPLPMTPGHIRPEASGQRLLAASAQFPFRARAPPAV
jgi:hypothetical protein